MASPAISFTRHPAAQGVAWLRRAFAMFNRYRLAWVLLFWGYFATLFVVNLVPLVGAFAVFAVKPVLAVGLLAAAWQQERGGAPTLRQLFHGLRSNVFALLAIGVFFVLGMAIAIQASALIDGGKLRDLASGHATLSEDEARDALADPQLQLAMLFSALLAIPTLLATWWAPALVVFQDAGAGAALGASLRAALANWRALIAYVLAVGVFGLVLPMALLTLLAVLLPTAALQVLVLLVMLPYSIVLTVTLHICDYVSYRDVFHAGETLAPLAPGTGSA
ncbi:MAG: hypothetical protein IT516_10055 [Burkholderiales bacterium]|nr:hypothetical protein [Burkholderiales bacterium]